MFSQLPCFGVYTNSNLSHILFASLGSNVSQRAPGEWDKIKNLTEISLIMFIDGHVDRREMQICHIIAKEYGLKESKMNYLGSIVFQYLKEGKITIDNYYTILQTNLLNK